MQQYNSLFISGWIILTVAKIKGQGSHSACNFEGRRKMSRRSHRIAVRAIEIPFLNIFAELTLHVANSLVAPNDVGASPLLAI